MDISTLFNMITAHPYKFVDLSIKAIALIGGICTAIYGLIQLRHSITRARHDYINDFHKEFLSPKILEKRKMISDFWKTKVTRESDKCSLINIIEIGNMVNDKKINCSCFKSNDEVNRYIHNKENEITDYLKSNAGITIEILSDDDISNIDDKIINTTEEILNKYEHLGKLYKGETNGVRLAKLQS